MSPRDAEVRRVRREELGKERGDGATDCMLALSDPGTVNLLF